MSYRKSGEKILQRDGGALCSCCCVLFGDAAVVVVLNSCCDILRLVTGCYGKIARLGKVVVVVQVSATLGGQIEKFLTGTHAKTYNL